MMSVGGRAGGRNFASANRASRDKLYPAVALSAKETRLPFRPPIALFLLGGPRAVPGRQASVRTCRSWGAHSLQHRGKGGTSSAEGEAGGRSAAVAAGSLRRRDVRQR